MKKAMRSLLVLALLPFSGQADNTSGGDFTDPEEGDLVEYLKSL